MGKQVFNLTYNEAEELIDCLSKHDTETIELMRHNLRDIRDGNRVSKIVTSLNAFWTRIGSLYGFDPTTVEPINSLSFKAVAVPRNTCK